MCLNRTLCSRGPGDEVVGLVDLMDVVRHKPPAPADLRADARATQVRSVVLLMGSEEDIASITSDSLTRLHHHDTDIGGTPIANLLGTRHARARPKRARARSPVGTATG